MKEVKVVSLEVLGEVRDVELMVCGWCDGTGDRHAITNRFAPEPKAPADCFKCGGSGRVWAEIGW